MKQGFFIGGGLLVLIVAMVALFNLAFSNDGIDYDNTETHERIAWTEQQAETLVPDYSNGLATTGIRSHQLSVEDRAVDLVDKRITLFVETKDSLVVITPQNFRMDLLTDLCPAYRRSGLHPQDIAVTFKLQRSNGEAIRSDTVSRTVCRQMRAFKKRAGA